MNVKSVHPTLVVDLVEVSLLVNFYGSEGVVNRIMTKDDWSSIELIGYINV